MTPDGKIAEMITGHVAPLSDGEATIARIHGDAEGKTVRVDLRVGHRLMARIEFRLEDFAAAVMSGTVVKARFATR